jgi:hypothetical protein
MDLALGNIYVRPNILAKKGDKVDGHTHNFPHVSYVCRGRVKITRTKPNGDRRTVSVSSTDDYPFVLILAEDTHELEAEEDNSMFHCLYAHRTPQGDVIQEYTGWNDAYK